MGVHLSLVNLEDAFRTLSTKPTIINDKPSFTDGDVEEIHKAIYTRHTPDMLSNIPKCDCGMLHGEFQIGVECSNCTTTVRHVTGEELETLTWIRAPKGVGVLINPIVWTLLSERFTYQGINIIQYLTDSQYNPAEIAAGKAVELIDCLPFKRGLKNFHAQFDEIMEFLFELRHFKLRGKNKPQVDMLRMMLSQYRDCIFAEHLPIPHRSLLVVEDSTSGNVYLDEYTPKAINAVLTLAGIDTSSASGEVTTSLRLRESRAVRAVARLAEFYYYICSKRLAKKEGIFRKHVYATRSHWSWRAVVSSITSPHDHEQIYIPWGVATSIFNLHLHNKLQRLGFTPNEADQFLHQYATRHHPLMRLLLDQLIAESGDPRGIPATLNRPPSLKRGSIQAVFISRIKDPDEGNTVSMSILIVRPLNCDFDGDALQFTLALDNYIAKALENLAPYKNIFSLDDLRGVSSAAEQPKTVVSTTLNWLNDTEEPLDQEAYARMMALPDAP